MNAELKVNPGSRIWRSLESRTADCGSVKSVSQPAIRNSQFARNPLVSFLADKRRNIQIVGTLAHHWPWQIIGWALYVTRRLCRHRRRSRNGRHHRRFAFKAGGNDRDLHLVAHVLIDYCPKNNIGIFIRGFTNNRRGSIYLKQSKIRSASDIDEHTLCTLNGSFLEQR